MGIRKPVRIPAVGVPFRTLLTLQSPFGQAQEGAITGTLTTALPGRIVQLGARLSF